MFPFFGTFKRRSSAQPGEVPQRVSEALESESRLIHSVDPDTPRQWQRLQMAIDREGLDRRVPAGRIWRFRPQYAYAAGVALVIFALVVWLNQFTPLRYETNSSQRSVVTLADSSEISLNYGSVLLVERRPLERIRRVRLSGEAYFRVRNTGSPFTVTTDVATIQVVGTEFDVRVRDDQISVGVTRGKVKVSPGPDAKEAVELGPGQITTFPKGGMPSPPVQMPFAEYPGWMHGKFLFYRTPLASACREIESEFGVTIRIDTPLLRSMTITGALDARNVDSSISTLSRLTGSSYRHENNTFMLY